MTSCFDNIVSLREYCTAETPFSDIYLNDIGLNQKTIEDIITGDYTTVKALVNFTIQMSIKEITTEIYGHFSNKIKTRSAIETGVSGVPASTKTLVSGAANERGQRLNLYNSANYLNIELSALSLFLNFSGDVDVNIYDLDQGKLLNTVTITAIAGEVVEVYPHIVLKSSRQPLSLFIGYDATGIDSYKTLTRSSVCCGSYGRKSAYLKSHGATVTGSAIVNNITTINDTAGLGIRYSIWCDQFAWLCTYAQMLALPIAYKTASEIYRRGKMVSPSTRSNNNTNINSDLLTENFNWHESKYRESMDRILKNIHLPSDEACFACNPVTRNVISLP